jgi:GT2 family glycosyltransferase
VVLSIVIVNYNVKEFLTQCLESIYRSKTEYTFEVIVVDNASADSGESRILKAFPEVRWIANTENIGFGRANNQGFEAAKGTYTLILNPDTVVQEDTLEVCIDYLMSHPEVGGLGIKGIDGTGQFLPESKRGLPTPMTALWKITGLSRIFTKSSFFARYHMGHLDPDGNHKVDILVGCFMMVPTALLREVGGFDPRYFMYGEDIDLSYELLKTGHENHYISDSQIIHYKGESTKRGSLNYVKMFYQAMIIFARKQFSGSSALAYTLLIYVGIYLRAGLALLARLAKSAATPIIDILLLAFTLDQLKTYWEHNHRFINGGSYPDTYTYYVQGSYILFWLLALALSGVYTKNTRPAVIARSMTIATLVIGFFYGLLPEGLRFSRALLLLGGLAGITMLILWRSIIGLLTGKHLFTLPVQRPRMLYLGSDAGRESLQKLLTENGIVPAFFLQDMASDNGAVDLEKLEAKIQLYNINECVVESTARPASVLMQIMSVLGTQTNVKSLVTSGPYIVGSNSSLNQGETYGLGQFNVADANYRRQKRLLDITLTLLLILTLPLSLTLAAIAGRAKGYINWLTYSGKIIAGKATLVGYTTEAAAKNHLPILPPPIFDIATGIPKVLNVSQSISALVTNYAKEAELKSDLRQLWELSKF